MKKTIVFLSAILIMSSCANNDSNKTATQNTTAETPAQPQKPDDPEAAKGMELIAKSDCLGCHKISEAMTGPAYEAVAAKYENNETTIDSLSNKIIKGGGGNWGTQIMAAHPFISKEEAKQMAKYVMSLKK